MKFATKEPIAEFNIDGQRYLVSSAPARSNGKYCRTYLNSEVVGEAIIENVKYAVLRAKNENRNHDEKGKKILDMLTKRELQIVMLVAEGRGNKQIAYQLKISEWTVSTHLRRIFVKLGVNSRAAMVYRCADKIIKNVKIQTW